MTKAEIENLINIIEDYVPKHCVVGYGDKEESYCRIDDLYKVLRDIPVKVLRDIPVEEEKACEPDWKAMHMRNAEEMDKMCVQLESMRKDMHNLSIEHARYVGAVAAMETIFGRKFDPQR